MLPGGSVTGCPKIAALDLIAALEPVGRGASMGALGRIHPNGDLDLALTIRTFAVADGAIHLWVGGGIVWDSDPAGGGRGVVGEGASAARGDRRAARGAGLVTLVALAELGRGVVPVDAPVLHADDEGVLRGRAVFETLRVYGGAPFRLDAHLDRLAASAERLRLPPPPRDEFARSRDEAIAAGGRARRDAAPALDGRARGRRRADRARARLDAAARARRSCARAACGSPSCAGRRARSPARSRRATRRTWRRRTTPAARGADDALLVAPDDTVLEAPTSNVWFREGDRLLTPSLELPILAGVTRAALVELAPGLGYEVEEGAFPLDRLLAADEVFLSSSVREVMPVVAVDGAPSRRAAPGRRRSPPARSAGGRGLPCRADERRREDPARRHGAPERRARARARTRGRARSAHDGRTHRGRVRAQALPRRRT